jgi:hypothetical protein
MSSTQIRDQTRNVLKETGRPDQANHAHAEAFAMATLNFEVRLSLLLAFHDASGID